ncbi:MAG: hypothetical protein ACRBB6_06475 [Neptuniibacter sp.]
MEQEKLRQQYLEAMGISSWFSCAQLSGALESPDWVNDFQFPAPEIPFEANRSQEGRASLQQNKAAFKGGVTETAAQSIAALNKAVEEKPLPVVAQPEKQLEPASDTVEVPESPSIERTPPNFKIAFQKIGAVLVIDSLPPQGGNFAQNYQRLAAAIVSSIGMAGDMAEPFMLPWPIFASKTLDQSKEQAVIAVQHKLNKELQANEIRAVLMLGESSAQMVLDRSESIEQLSGVLFTLSGGVKAIASASLTEAMQLTGVKKQIWTDLQPLLSHISNTVP